MEISGKHSREHAAGVELLLLAAVVPGAIKEFCDNKQIPETALPQSRMHDRDFARFILNVAKGGPVALDSVWTGAFAAAVPNFPKALVPELFAYVAEAVRGASSPLKMTK